MRGLRNSVPALFRWFVVAFVPCLVLATACRADDHFTVARKILETRCVECHGGRFTRHGLDLVTREGLIKGGESGPTVVPGKADESHLYKRIVHAIEPGMPFKRPALSQADQQAIAAWINAGATYDAPLTRPAAEEWWSLTPLKLTVPPAVPVEWQGQSRNPIDAFILARLKEKGLAPSPEADRRTWLRRVYYDLVGLPPTLEQIEAFASDQSADAHEKVVDRLLASPGYGERWARHWMDVVHYAETHGNDQDRPRPNAWPYRDYLIHSFNADKPYARFVAEQLAGDILFPDDPQATVALGMLATGPWDESSLMSIQDDTVDKRIAQYLDRDDMVATAMGTFVSSTVHCARCHDHKFDPIPQVDYYRLQAVFAGVDKAERSYEPDPQVARRRSQLGAELTRLQTLRGDPAALAAASFPETVQVETRAWELAAASAAQLWMPVNAMSFTTANGSTLTKQPDGSLLASGTRPERETYTITALVDVPQITGVRLEVLADDSLPMKGPGRQDNGNLHLNEFKVTVAPQTDQKSAKPVALRNAVADFNQDAWTIGLAVDGNPGTAWGIFPKVGVSHRAVFELQEAVPAAGGVLVTFVLEQTHGGGHLIGRPRLSVTSAQLPLPIDPQVLSADVAAVLQLPAEQRTGAQKNLLAVTALASKVERELAALPKPQMIFAATNDFKPDGNFRPAKAPREIHVLSRGEITKPLAVATPGALSCVPGLSPEFSLTNPQDEGARRAALAKWTIDPQNVLTWRSIANRVWNHHFGRGLCDTPNDFGRMGGKPSHPELIDWLAVELQQSGGSLKHLHRLIVTSATYRQSSQHNAKAAEVDGENRLLWRMNRQRLDAESIRDTLLQVTGKLDLAMGGASVKQFIQSPGIHVTPDVNYLNFDPDQPENFRRSVYRFVFRTLPDPFMDSLDCADSSQLTPVRNISMSALQALAMLNNKFVVRQSEHLATRAADGGIELQGQVSRVYELALGRRPTAKELRSVSEYAARHGLANACRVVLNSNEFLFVD